MRELSLHILDIAQNSLTAGARSVEIDVTADGAENLLPIVVRDDGCGMSPEFLARVTDPFTTKRTTRKVGLGIPLFRQAAELAGGEFSIESQEGVGTCVKATFQLDHIDRMPLGDLAGTLTALIGGSPGTEFHLRFEFSGKQFDFDTREIKETLQGVPIDSYEVLAYLRDYINENITYLTGGITL